MAHCPCCSTPLLRHINGHEVYWFCRNCWEKMPILSSNRQSLEGEFEIGKLPRLIKNSEQFDTSISRKKQIEMQNLPHAV